MSTKNFYFFQANSDNALKLIRKTETFNDKCLLSRTYLNNNPNQAIIWATATRLENLRNDEEATSKCHTCTS
ncbi:hypothetical protein LR1_00650 [Lacticaseibacillus rhamnosus DSM 20021 = JCM 1136 = NBRC 3425]|nr:hypothetical protein LR1_00650 [Lacticaseibacillus rhamnosus DSM 20021 = JCM 1136 = NBRC 3425]